MQIQIAFINYRTLGRAVFAPPKKYYFRNSPQNIFFVILAKIHDFSQIRALWYITIVYIIQYNILLFKFSYYVDQFKCLKTSIKIDIYVLTYRLPITVTCIFLPFIATITSPCEILNLVVGVNFWKIPKTPLQACL